MSFYFTEEYGFFFKLFENKMNSLAWLRNVSYNIDWFKIVKSLKISHSELFIDSKIWPKVNTATFRLGYVMSHVLSLIYIKLQE